MSSHSAHWSLAARGYGYGDALVPLSGAAPQASANRVEYRRGAVTEWYVNGPMGLEQGFTLSEPPGKPNRQPDHQPVTVALALSGDLVAAVDPGGKAVTLTRKDGQVALRYTGLTARDAAGRDLRTWLELHGERLLLRVEDKGARYPLVVDPWVQEAELIASDGEKFECFGVSAAVDGTTVVVGAPCHIVGSNQSQGAAYVFVQSGEKWTQQAELITSDGAANDQFGSFVAVSGSTVVV
ncbi:MAG: FG-GAP repeat protein, partial [Mycobacteriales bacterium]